MTEKVNSDGSLKNGDLHSGIGFTIRDHRGTLMTAGAKAIVSSSILFTEAIAAKEALITTTTIFDGHAA